MKKGRQFKVKKKTTTCWRLYDVTGNQKRLVGEFKNKDEAEFYRHMRVEVHKNDR